jgi:hypothetical protein
VGAKKKMSVGPSVIILSSRCFTLSEPIWVCDLGTGKNQFFINLPVILMDFCFFANVT